MISISYDEESGIVRTAASGLASVEDFNVYMPSAIELMARSRARHGCSLHLVDASGNPVQSKDTFESMARASEAVLQEGEVRAWLLAQATIAETLQ